MGTYRSRSARPDTKGFTLIASLLMLLLLSGIAIGLMMMVNTEGKVGGTDLQNDRAFHAAEGGIEKMSADLNSTFQNAQAPTASQICAVGGASYQPSMVGVTWTQYSVMPGSSQSTTCPTTLTANWGEISGNGQNAGLWAQIIPVNMLVTADLVGGQEVSMTRQAQVALIPVFQFGVFSDSDLSFFSGPNFDMVGPVHTNGDLYPFVGPGSTLSFHSQLSAYGNVIRTQLANGYSASVNYNGTVDIPTNPSGCSTSTTNCTAMPAPSSSSYGDGSVTGAGSSMAQSASTYNASNWNTFSKSTTSLMLINGNYGSTSVPGTGAKKLSMPFVNGTTFPYEIIRRPQPTDSSSLTQSREYNLAQIHVLLSDNPADLPGGSSDANNVRLANVGSYQYGVPTSYPSSPSPWKVTAPTGGNFYSTYFATALNGYRPDTSTCAGSPCPANACTSGTYTYSCLPADWPLAPDTMASAVASETNVSPANQPLIYKDATVTDTPTTFALCPPTGGTYSIPSANIPPNCPTTTAPTSPYLATMTAPTQTWNLIDGWLRVEYRDANGTWHPVTTEWLKLGFARDLNPPTQNTAGSGETGGFSNDINPNAILLLQQPADRNGDGTIATTGTAPVCTAHNTHNVCTSWTNPVPPDVQIDAASSSYFLGLNISAGTPLTTTTYTTTAKGQTATNQSVTMNNWYPINFYDAREGEPRDVDSGANNSCTTMGVMNAVEIDVGNLQLWLQGTIGSSGTNVDYVAQNGYVLYFSDRRGMLYNQNAGGIRTGDAGLEDVINSSSQAGTPDGILEPIPSGRSLSPEDVNQNGLLDNWGTGDLGLGQWNGSLSLTTGLFTKTAGGSQNAQIYAATPDNPYSPRISSCMSTARKNWVSGARHVLRLVDGSLGNLPLSPSGTATDPGGLTVASENPVYIMGDYNSNSTDSTWASTPTDATGHASAAVIADAVTVLSNNWLDELSMENDTTLPSNRPATNTYYRLAIASGKNINFPQPTWGAQDYGTDGGVHNFLRYLENWGPATLNYKGSIVSLFYATYNTGIYKCCTDVYSPPSRNYVFDSDFTLPQGLPPGTPMFRDVETLTYRQLFATRQTGQ